MDGVLVVDKPAGWTSHDVVARVRRLAGTRKVGHLGTLDPMATGVLPLLLNGATRLAQFFNRDRKTYEGVIRFGQSTDTYDREGTPVSPEVEPSFGRGELEAALDRFRGTFEQVPPPVSAKKIAGTPAYKLARKKQPVELEPVKVTVETLDLLDFDGRDATVRVVCSAGTYVRGIAHDAGKLAGCGAYLYCLRRTASGDFTIQDAHPMDELNALAGAGRFDEAVLAASRLLPHFPAETVDALTAGQIRQGRDFRVSPFRARGGRFVRALNADGDLVAIGEAIMPNVYHPVVVLRADE